MKLSFFNTRSVQNIVRVKSSVLFFVLMSLFQQSIHGENASLLPIDTAIMTLPDIPSFAPVVKKVMPAVVNISVEYESLYLHPFFSDPFFRSFFGNQVPAERVQEQAVGSGTLVGKDGIVLTCAHVVNGGKKIKVNLRDGRSFDAKLIFMNENEDVAFLKLLNVKSDENLPVVELGTPGERHEGDWAIAVGYPEGSSLVTAGIVASSDAVLNNHRVMKITADLGPGMSGGGVFDAKGKLMAVPNAILAKLSTLTKHGFAIPIAIPLKYIKGLDQDGHIKQPWHGLKIGAVQDKMGGQNNPMEENVIVTGLHKKSPAALSGLRPGDRLLAVNGKDIKSRSDFNTLLGAIGVGEEVTLKVKGEQEDKTIRYVAIEAPLNEKGRLNDALVLTKGFLAGVSVIDASSVLGEVQEDSVEGVMVADIKEGSQASRSFGLQKRDIIEKVNGKDIHAPKDLEVMDLGNRITILINRGGAHIQASLSMMG
ncbi:MAG: PDZ domain-containing protein [Alphaproteobacteria bacterium]|nr:PDZ domain-containing protein [Alphaproteobacteria bacterium]